MDSSCHLSQLNLTHEYDENYFLTRQLEREENEFRRHEEEKNRLAVIELLNQEEKTARVKRKSQLEESLKVALELQKQDFFEHEQQHSLRDEIEVSSFVSYRLLLKEHLEQEESLRIVQQLQIMKKLQTMKKPQQAHQRRNQEYNEKPLAFKTVIKTEVKESSTSPPTTIIWPSEYATNVPKSNRNKHKHLDTKHLPTYQKDINKGLHAKKEDKVKKFNMQMFKKHSKSGRKNKRKFSWKRFMSLLFTRSS